MAANAHGRRGAPPRAFPWQLVQLPDPTTARPLRGKITGIQIALSATHYAQTLTIEAPA